MSTISYEIIKLYPHLTRKINQEIIFVSERCKQEGVKLACTGHVQSKVTAKRRKLSPCLDLPPGTKSVSELVKRLPLLFHGTSQGGGVHFC